MLGHSERGQKRPEGQQVEISGKSSAAVIANSVWMRKDSWSTWSHAEDCRGLSFNRCPVGFSRVTKKESEHFQHLAENSRHISLERQILEEQSGVYQS